MPTPNQGRSHNSRKHRKKLKNAMGFHIAYLSFISWASWLIQSVVRTHIKNSNQAERIFQGLR